MWAVILVSIIIAFLVYVILAPTLLNSLFPTGDNDSENIQYIKSDGQIISIGENPTIEDNKLTILSNGLKTYKMKSLSSFSVSIFMKVSYLPRTGTFIDCETEAEKPAFTGKYDCKESRFPNCKITTTNLCKRQGYRQLFSVGNAIRFELLETQNPQRPGIARAQLSVQTQEMGTTSTKWMETFSLPEFPLQKWMMLTIVRKGNYYSVYYNNSIAGSFKTTYVPYIDAAKIQLGESTVIKGVATYLSVFPRALTAAEINARYTTFTETTGAPKLSIPLPQLKGLCVSGNCFQGPTVQPANPFVQWSQDYN